MRIDEGRGGRQPPRLIGPKRPIGQALALTFVLAMCLEACEAPTPLVPVNRSPIFHSLTAFPTTIGLGDSAIVLCNASDPDGDSVICDWTSNCQLIKQGAPHDFTAYQRGPRLVVYAGACSHAPLDTGWVICDLRDGRGGGARGGIVRIVVRQ